MSEHITIGILAHVDAGKTTLSEALLYLCGAIKKAGRVDHKDSFLDTDSLERERGITIFSKQAKLNIGEYDVTLLDTPGHNDFSPEAERTLQILDYAILIISAADSVTGHTVMLWKLLSHYNVPVFIFVNKMDQPGADKDGILEKLREKLAPSCIDFTHDINDPFICEDIAVCDERLLDNYLNGGEISADDVKELIRERKTFPCLFGSALQMTGIKEFIDILASYMKKPEYLDETGARVFKISRDEQGNRLTWMKLTGGRLYVKESVRYSVNNTSYDEKADQLRIYSGEKYELRESICAGEIAAVTGLTKTMAGQGLFSEKGNNTNLMQPVMSCEIILPEGTDRHKAFRDLKTIEEEEPMLSVACEEETGSIEARVMGRVQMEVLAARIKSRFGYEISYGSSRIVYKETILNTIEGVGHFEPLRHYAEVHLKMEPLEPGSGLVFSSDCSFDLLDRNWQRLILTHLSEKKHRGVLTGSEITDMKITVIGGKAHEKHTEGGDFRQATYRAVRQGLMMAENLLLEPVYKFTIDLPLNSLGRAVSDIQRMYGTVDEQKQYSDKAIITGRVPVSEAGDYAGELSSYTRGFGIITLEPAGYAPCHNAEEIIETAGYDPEADTANPSASVFCSHGTGTLIPYDKVYEYMHVDTGFNKETERKAVTDLTESGITSNAPNSSSGRSDDPEGKKDARAAENELRSIFERTYGPIRKKEYNNDPLKDVKKPPKAPVYKGRPQNPKDEYLLVDGYNIIFASDELKSLAAMDINAARDRLIDILIDFKGYRNENVILVFDAYRVSGGKERVIRQGNIDIVYTGEAETADQYIEKCAHSLKKDYRVTVATNDQVEQVIILGSGALRMSARDLLHEIDESRKAVNEYIKAAGLTGKSIKNTMEDKLNETGGRC
ncbi:MAG: NYN domain-containing protein [Lachnospiraceae bacterium]|nr:NYN domain-containing protein [Lachnospiraceae bacterium]